jgi:hypothetical protein
VRHVPDGTLRRFIDETFAVADRDIRHVEGCARCRARSQRFDADAAAVAGFFDVPAVVITDAGPAQSRSPVVTKLRDNKTLQFRPHRSWRLAGVSLSTGASVAAVGVVIAGVAAAATLTTVFAPTQVAPVAVSRADLHDLTQLMGMNMTGPLGGFRSPSGSETLGFGTMRWTSSGNGSPMATLREAESETGLAVRLPTKLPNGVGAVDRIAVMPKVTATIIFGADAGADLSGSSLVVSLGPAVGVSYGGTTTLDGIGPLAILTMAQPKATSSGATTSEIENFLLTQPGVPADLAEQIRLLGNLQATLPIPTPPGATTESTEVDGSPAVVLVDNSNAASAAVWEDHSGDIHAVAGLLDKEDLLNVARQIG